MRDMFPHTVTIYRHALNAQGADTYTRYEVSGVYIYGQRAISVNGKGPADADGITVVTSVETAQAYGTSWQCTPGDRLVKGTGPSTITSFKDLDPYQPLTVLSVFENLAGSVVDDIILTAK